MNYSVCMTSSLFEDLQKHLVRSDEQEDLCFAVWYPSNGADRQTALIHTLILPESGDRQVHGNTSFNPCYFERAIALARSMGGGLAFLHSHPYPGWQRMSNDDVKAERSNAGAAKAATDLPLVGITMGSDGAMSARFWTKVAPKTYERQWCVSVRVVGKYFKATFNDNLLPPPKFREEQRRTVSSWGEAAQAHLARIKIGIIGLGSVGSMIAEALARLGIQCVVLIDFDLIETHNLDRLLLATKKDVGKRKIDVISREIKKSATADGFTVKAVNASIIEADGFRNALDCDLLFSCVDRPWPRSVLNFMAFAHLIPVVDGGISVETNRTNTALRRADWRAHISTPTRQCLACIGQYNSGEVSLERDGYLDDPKYIAGLPDNSPFKRNENVFAFSMSTASFEILQFLSMVIGPLGVSDVGAQTYHFVNGRLDTHHEECHENCFFRRITAKGDCSGVSVTGAHKIAEEKRKTARGSIGRTLSNLRRKVR